jgi:hypothetical protein
MDLNVFFSPLCNSRQDNEPLIQMEGVEETIGEGAEVEAPVCSTVAVAVSGSRSSRHALKWALDKFVPEGRVLFRILHVRPPVTMVPTPSERASPFSLSLIPSTPVCLSVCSLLCTRGSCALQSSETGQCFVCTEPY